MSIYLYVVRSPRREALRTALNAEGIGTGIHYPIPIHLQPVFHSFNCPPGSLPETERVVEEILSLPMYPELTMEQAERVAAVIRKA